MERNYANNTTTPWIHYKEMVAGETCVTIETLNRHTHWVQKSYDRGEPVWMAVEALRVVVEQSKIRPMMTPRQLALRVVRVG